MPLLVGMCRNLRDVVPRGLEECRYESVKECLRDKRIRIHLIGGAAGISSSLPSPAASAKLSINLRPRMR